MGGDWIRAVRNCLRAPASTFSLAATFAIGAGCATAVWTIVHGVLLAPLPYPDPDRLVLLRADYGDVSGFPAMTPGGYHDARERVEVFDEVGGASSEFDLILRSTPTSARAIRGINVTPSLLALLGVRPAAGRVLEDHDRAFDGPARAAMISHGLWQEHFGGAPEAIGGVVELSGSRVEVVGVLPEDFRLLLGEGARVGERIDVWFPWALPDDRGGIYVRTVARLRPEVAFPDVQPHLDRLRDDFATEFPEVYVDLRHRIFAVPLLDDVSARARPTLTAAAWGVVLLLLVSCANATGLILAGVQARSRDLSVRVSLGASAGSVIRPLALELFVVAALGAAGALLLAAALVGSFLRLAPDALPRATEIGIGPGALLTALGLTLGTGALAAAVPLRRVLRLPPAAVLRAGGRGAVEGGGRVRTALAIGQVAFAVILLSASGLLLKTLNALAEIELGYDVDGVETVQVPLDGTAIPDSLRADRYHRFVHEVESLPEVSSAGLVNVLPLRPGGLTGTYSWDAESERTAGTRSATYRWVTAGFFRTLDFEVVRGRAFEPDDDEGRRLVVVLDEEAARVAFGTEDPIGRRLQVTPNWWVADEGWATVVGVVRHARLTGVAEPGLPQIYLPLHTRPMPSFALVAEMRTPAGTGWTHAVAGAAERAELGLPPHSPATMVDIARDAVRPTRLALTAIGVLAWLTTALAGFGIYAVVSVLVAAKRREYGVRLALGASPDRIALDGIRHAGVIAILGVGVGLIGVGQASPILGSLLVGVDPLDVWTLTWISAGALFLVLLAGLPPALGAGRTDPAETLSPE